MSTSKRDPQGSARKLLEVLGSGGCPRHATSDVIVQVAWRAQRPVFVNFLDSRKRGDDLLSVPMRLTEQRGA